MNHSDKFLDYVKNAKSDPTDPVSANFLQFQDGSDAIVIGLSRREYFAAMAMTGLLTRVPKRDGGETDLGIFECKRIAAESRIMADELIEALNK